MLNARLGYAVGDEGTVLRLDGRDKTVTPVDAGVSERLNAVVAIPGLGQVVAVGAGGAIYRSARGQWVKEASPVTTALNAIAVAESGVLWVVGDGGVVLFRAPGDTRWRQQWIGADRPLRAVTVDPRGAVLASDGLGGLWARGDDGGAWRLLKTPGLPTLVALAPLAYVQMRPIPRDIRYLYQSSAPLPSVDAYARNPAAELGLPLKDRTAVQRGYRTPVLFGGITWERAIPGDEKSRILKYNSALLVDGMGRVAGRYDKNYPLLFGEYLPFGETFPVLYEWIPESGGFVAGRDVEVFPFGEHRIGVMICYEDILPGFARKLASRRPNVIVNVTNDAWFGETAEPYLHLTLSVLRSVESRVMLVRSTNTGVSAVIDPVGRLVGQTSLHDAEVLEAELVMMPGGTVYERIGDGFSYLLLLLLAGWWWRRVPARPRST